ncbi:hypothetical protein [Anaerotruncus rubiinfantis]|uniref:hypothetical protein n=1 Tax=Anaerotruncus rubiinfantis TaxID=1720200 RepID=UPI0034A38E9C
MYFDSRILDWWKSLAFEKRLCYSVVNNRSVDALEKSRAEYFRERRKKYKQFVVMVEHDKVQALDSALRQKGISRAQWLREKIEEEIVGEESL